MLPSSTVFVIGAGSGYDISMPLGADLLKMIGSQTNFKITHGQIHEDPQALTYAMFYGEVPGSISRVQLRSDIKETFDANKRIGKALRLIGSIDDYVNLHHSDAVLVRAAKIQIAYSILRSERSCKLMPQEKSSPVTELSSVQDTWLFDFFRMITKPSISIDPADVFKNVSVINFNYDRCFEQFMISALPNLYNISTTEASQIVRSANIIHPYGQVGDLPLMVSSATSVGFGDDTRFENVVRASETIKTYTEQVNSNLAQQIMNTVHTASKIVFLGFGFHKQNVDLLAGSGSVGNGRPIYGTAIGESDANIVEYSVRLEALGGSIIPGQRQRGNVFLMQHYDCATLLRSYREAISA